MKKINFFEHDMFVKFLKKDKSAFDIDLTQFDLEVKNTQGKNLLTYILQYAHMLNNYPSQEQLHYLIHSSNLSSCDSEGRTALFYLITLNLSDKENELIKDIPLDINDWNYLLDNTQMDLKSEIAILKLLAYNGKLPYVGEDLLTVWLENVHKNKETHIDVISIFELNLKSFSYAWPLIKNKDIFIKLIENEKALDLSNKLRHIYPKLLSSPEFLSYKIYKEKLLINKALPSKISTIHKINKI